MAKWFWPISAVAAIVSGVWLWETMTDAERARWFSLLIGIPHSTFLGLGLLGYSGELPKNTLEKALAEL